MENSWTIENDSIVALVNNVNQISSLLFSSYTHVECYIFPFKE